MKKILASGVVFMLAVTQTAGLYASMQIEVRPAQEMPAVMQLRIPEELANLEEIYEAPPKFDPRLIIHIQNAHGHYDAQVQIKKLLDYLHKNYGFDLLFVEGAAEAMDPSQLQLFEEKEKNVELIHYFAKKGQATGADLFLMEEPDAMTGVGIEETELYQKNYQAFLDVYGKNTEIDTFLQAFQSKLNTLSSLFLNASMRRLISEWGKFSQGHREFLPYVKRLTVESRKILGLDLESLFAQVEWPQITRLLVLQSMEADLDRDRALLEKQKLIEFLKKQNLSAELIQGIEALEEKGIKMYQAASEAGSAQALMPRHLLEKLVDEAGASGFRFQDYPAFSLYAGYLILQSELKPTELFDEIEELFKKILDKLAVTEEEKDLLELFRDIELLEKAMHLELNRKEWGRAFYRRDWVHPDAMMKRLQSVSDRILATGKHQFPTIIQAGDLNLASSVETVFNAALQFYEFARQREKAFYFKIKQEMTERNQKKAVLITGGFHTDGLMELFREDNISYGIVTPKISSPGDPKTYVSAMKQDNPTIFDFANLEVISLLQRMETKGAQGMDTSHQLVGRLDALFNVLKPTSLEGLDRTLKFFNQESGKLNGIQFERKSTSDTAVEIRMTSDGKPVVFADDRREIIIPLRLQNDVWGLAGNRTIRGAEISGDSYPLVLAAATAAPVQGKRPDWDASALTNPAEIVPSDAVIPTQVADGVIDESMPSDQRIGLITNLSEADNVENGRDPQRAVASLAGRIMGNNASDGVAEFEEYLRSQLPASSQTLAKYTSLSVEGGYAVPAVILPASALEFISPTLKAVAELLAQKENRNVHFVVALSSAVENPAELQATETEKLAELRSEMRQMNLDPSVLDRLTFRIIPEGRLAREVQRMSRKAIEKLHNQLLDERRGPVPSIEELSRAYASLVYAEAVSELLSPDLFSGARLQHKISIESVNEIYAIAIAAQLLARYGSTISAEKISEMTVSALERFGKSNDWGFTESFSSFVTKISEAMAALEAEMSFAESA